jgi:hypothetical protein
MRRGIVICQVIEAASKGPRIYVERQLSPLYVYQPFLEPPRLIHSRVPVVGLALDTMFRDASHTFSTRSDIICVKMVAIPFTQVLVRLTL